MSQCWQPEFKGTWVPEARLVGEFATYPLRHLLELSDISIHLKYCLLPNEILAVVHVSSGGNQGTSFSGKCAWNYSVH